MKKLFVLLFFLFFFLVTPSFFVAQAAITENPGLGCVLKPPDGGATTLAAPSLGCLGEVIISIINIAFVFLGAVAVLFILYGSIKFILSGGNDKSVASARNTLMYAILGTAVVILAFFIIRVVSQTFGIPDVIGNFTLYQP